MPKKKWTDEERAAFGEKMRVAKLKKETHGSSAPEQPVEKATEPSQAPDGQPKTTISENNDVSELLRRIQELESAQWRQSQTQPVEPGIKLKDGRLTGTVEKYDLSAEHYPSPTERLAKESRLAPVAFEYNYELAFEIGESGYTTIDGIRMKEPKFTLKLIRIILDEVTGEQTNGRYTVCQLIMHEDPEAALVIARDNGVEVEAEDEISFLNEMRYLRARDWLLDCFYPKPPEQVNNKKEMVINGKLVEYFEVNSEQSTGIPFAQLSKKL